MSQHSAHTKHAPKTPDVDLMLRTHAELRCLSREVIPVLRDIEAGSGLPDEQLGAAFAYLETMWIEAQRRAAETDAAFAALSTALRRQADRDAYQLSSNACRYRNAVTTLRRAVSLRVAQLLATSEQATPPLSPSQPILRLI